MSERYGMADGRCITSFSASKILHCLEAHVAGEDLIGGIYGRNFGEVKLLKGY